MRFGATDWTELSVRTYVIAHCSCFVQPDEVAVRAQRGFRALTGSHTDLLFRCIGYVTGGKDARDVRLTLAVHFYLLTLIEPHEFPRYTPAFMTCSRNSASDTAPTNAIVSLMITLGTTKTRYF
jgi:hypothetical protein